MLAMLVLQDAMDQLIAAADTILESIHPSNPDGGDDGGDGSTLFSKSQSQSKGGSRVGSKSGGGSVRRGGPGTKSVGTKSTAASTVAPPATLAATRSTKASTVSGDFVFLCEARAMAHF